MLKNVVASSNYHHTLLPHQRSFGLSLMMYERRNLKQSQFILLMNSSSSNYNNKADALHNQQCESRRDYFSKVSCCKATSLLNNVAALHTGVKTSDPKDTLVEDFQSKNQSTSDNPPPTKPNEQVSSKTGDITQESPSSEHNMPLSPFKTFVKRSSMILSKPNIVLNKNVFPTLASSEKAVKFMAHSLEVQKKVQKISNASLSIPSETLSTSKFQHGESSATLQKIPARENPEINSFLYLNQFDKITLFKGRSLKKTLIKNYSMFLNQYPSIIILNNTLDRLSKRQKHEQVQTTFKELIYYLAVLSIYNLKKQGIHVIRPDHFTINVVMTSYMTVGNVDAVQALYDCITPWTGTSPNYMNFITMLTSFARSHNFQKVSKYFEEYIDGKLELTQNLKEQPNLSYVFSVALKAFLDSGDFASLEKTYEKFMAMGLRPSLHIQNIMINFYRKQKNYAKCLEIFKYGRSLGKPDLSLTHSMMIVYGEMQRIDKVEKLFAKIENKTTDFTFKIMTNTYCAAGLVAQAEEFFSRVAHRDDKLLISMMKMYSQLGMLEKLQEMFSLVQKKTADCVSVYIDGLARFGNYSKVEEWVKQIPKDLRDSGWIWSCRLQSAMKSIDEFKDHDEYLEVVKRIYQERPENLTPQKQSYGSNLLNRAICAHLARRSMKLKQEYSLKPINESVEDVFKEFAEEQVKKANQGSEEGKFQTRTPKKEQLALNKNSIYRPDYVSPYEAFLRKHQEGKKEEFSE